MSHNTTARSIIIDNTNISFIVLAVTVSLILGVNEKRRICTKMGILLVKITLMLLHHSPKKNGPPS
jgi:hypothetical protein